VLELKPLNQLVDLLLRSHLIWTRDVLQEDEVALEHSLVWQRPLVSHQEGLRVQLFVPETGLVAELRPVCLLASSDLLKGFLVDDDEGHGDFPLEEVC
jgi:hypothetical protein